jgi:hypothetical protein
MTIDRGGEGGAAGERDVRRGRRNGRRRGVAFAGNGPELAGNGGRRLELQDLGSGRFRRAVPTRFVPRIRIHGYREPIEERLPKILETHRQALTFALFSVLIGAVWVWSVGTPMDDDWLPAVIGGCAWLARSVRAWMALARLRRPS